MQHSVFVMEKIVWQSGNVVVVGIERPQLMTAVKPVGYFGKQIVTYVDMPNVFWQRLYNQST